MSSIFAWNMRGFNMPRKQKAVKQWVRAAKPSIGCLLETKVKVGNFQKLFDLTFPGWGYLHNYSHHGLGRIWVRWSDEVEVCHVFTSAQMITAWVKYKSSGFLRMDIKDGCSVRFWTDIWHPLGRLIEITGEVGTQNLGIARESKICEVLRDGVCGGFEAVVINTLEM
ncbi:hypothetical protein IGI04_026272 [Brassica rapa subsp. trilocularis]|uniref:DUF4283 domain-containing protein n=1 Tax=Brassica rapa subsp. trilocularis TaxID=1813537 RepID=A0ABQ7KY77_BRACM|nr:hypothetical protein IGI04_026272 [Brassica rapa subsp. trilocularis]